MPTITMPYGTGSFSLDMAESSIMNIINANRLNLPRIEPVQAVREAISSPIDSPPLDEILKAGEKVCLIVPDITRVYESPFISTPVLLEAINRCGVKDEDITILCATGTHRRMTGEEHRKLLGDEVVKRIRVVDHQCQDKPDLKYIGETSRKTPVYFNRHACEADKIIISGGIVYHFLAGFGGGGKLLLPGIAGGETIQRNHELALIQAPGGGRNPQVRAGNMDPSNPLRSDINEAAAMLPPSFALNVVVNDQGRILRAFAGNWLKAHARGCKFVAEMEGVKIPEKSDFVIASAGGSPKDINLYQGSKLLSNALAAAKPGATIVLIAKFPEGFGNPDCENLIRNFRDMRSREELLRSNFSIGAFTGYLVSEACEKYNIVLVTDMPAEDFANTRTHITHNLEEGMKIALKLAAPGARAIIMPHGASTLPIPPEEE